MNRRLAAIGGVLLAALAVYAFVRPGHTGGSVPPTNRQLTIGITQEFENLNPVIMSMSATTYLFRMVLAVIPFRRSSMRYLLRSTAGVAGARPGWGLFQ